MGEDRNTNANTNEPIRVLLADDHTLFREGLAGILASYRGMEVIAEVPNDAQALRLVGELSPDVVIMQVLMPFERAIDTLEAMRSFPDPKSENAIVGMPTEMLEETGRGAEGVISARELEILLLAARGLSNERA